MYRNYSISVVIPCHNEEKGLEQVFKKIPEFIDEIIVINNLSTDNTSSIAKKLGARVINENNKGYGFAIKTGINKASGDIVITIDGDGTYSALDSKDIVDFLIDKDLGFVSCSRFPLKNKKSMHWQNFLGNKTISFLMSILFLRKFKDGLSGMWVFKKEIYSLLLPLSSGWNISEEIKIKAATNLKIKFGEYNINYDPRFGKSKVWPIKVGIENIIYLFYLRFLK